MRVAVTGARGFLGSHLDRRLGVEGHAVVRIGRGEHGRLQRLDDGSAALFEDVDAVVHLAAALVTDPSAPLADYLEPNVALVDELFADAESAGVATFVHASSRLVYPSDLGRPARETDPLIPEIPYGVSKLFSEQVVELRARASGVRACSLRLSQLVGPGHGDRGVLGAFANRAERGEPVIVAGAGDAVRDFLDVRDAASAISMCLDTDVELPPALNVGGGPRTIRELAEIAVGASGASLDLIEHRETGDEDRSFWALDSTLAASTIGWAPEYGLADSVRDRHEPA